MLDGTDGAHHGIELQVFVNLGFAAYAGSIHKHKLVAELVAVPCEWGIYGIAGGAGHRSYDVAVRAEQGIGKRGFAHIRLSHYRYSRKSRIRVLGLDIFRKHLHYGIQQVARARTVGCGDAEEFAQSHRIELIRVIHLLSAVHFVYGKNHRLPGPAEHICDFGIVVRHSCRGFDHKENHIRFIDGNLDLLTDGSLENIVGIGGVTAGIHYREFAAAPLATAVMAVAGNARNIVHNCLAHADKTVEKG